MTQPGLTRRFAAAAVAGLAALVAANPPLAAATTAPVEGTSAAKPETIRAMRSGEREHARAIVPTTRSPRPEPEREPVVPPELCERLGEEILVFRAPGSTFAERAAAAERILEIGPPVRPALRSVLSKLDGDAAGWIALVIGKTADQRALPLLARKYDSKDPSVRAAVLQAVADIGDPRALSIVQRALRDEEASVRRLGAASLRRFPAADVAPLVHAVVAALFDADAEVRALARVGLERLPLVDDADGAADVIALVTEALLASPADAVDDAAALSAAIAHDRVRDALIEASSDVSRPAREGVVRALGAFRGEKVRRALEMSAADHDEAVAAAAALALERQGDERSVRPLIGALITARGSGRTRIAAALRELTGQSFGSEPEPWQAWWLDHGSGFDE